MKKYLILLLGILVLSSCAKVRVLTVKPYSGAYSGKTMGYFPAYFGPIKQPVLPLIDAAAFNAKTNEIADQIMDMQKQKIDTIREQTRRTIEENYGFHIVTSRELENDTAFITLREKYNNLRALLVDDKNFPIITMASGDINIFNFQDGNVTEYLSNPQNSKYSVKQICNMLGLDGLIITYSRFNVIGVTGFGISGNIRLETYLYVYNQEGDLIAEGVVASKPEIIGGKYVEEYSNRLYDYPMLIKLLVLKLANEVTQ